MFETIYFETVKEGFLVLLEEYKASEVTAGEMIEFMLNENMFDERIEKYVLKNAIIEFLEWDENEYIDDIVDSSLELFFERNRIYFF